MNEATMIEAQLADALAQPGPNTADQVRQLMNRLAAEQRRQGRYLTGADVEFLMARVIKKLRDEFNQQLRFLQQRTAELEGRPAGVQYCGVWRDDQDYVVGSLTTCDGGLWLCERAGGTRKP